MKIRGTSVRNLVCFTIVALGPVLLSPPRCLGGDVPRPIASLTIQQRLNLPGNTRVQLKGGRIATLAELREEHQRRMQRFANASALGKAAHGRMPPINPQISSKTARLQEQGDGTRRSGIDGKAALALDANPGISMAPNTFIANSDIPLPRDYMAACAGSTACLYLPARTYLASWGPSISGDFRVYDIDPMITDSGLCTNDGGLMDPNGVCVFNYPMRVSENYQLARKQSTTGQCDPPMKFKFDPANVIKVWYDAPDNAPNYLVLQDALTCVIQVWQSR